MSQRQFAVREEVARDDSDAPVEAGDATFVAAMSQTPGRSSTVARRCR